MERFSASRADRDVEGRGAAVREHDERVRQIIVRVRNIELSEGDDRTIRGRCVPYGEVETVDDGQGPYKEMFEQGAFRRAARRPTEGDPGLRAPRAIRSTSSVTVIEFVEGDDGLHGTFRAIDGPVGDQGLELVRAGVLTGMSVRAVVLGPGRRRGDVIVRTACHLDRVALCRQPAYAGAVVEALRSADPMASPPKLSALRPPRNIELDEKIRALRERGMLRSADLEADTPARPTPPRWRTPRRGRHPGERSNPMRQ